MYSIVRSENSEAGLKAVGQLLRTVFPQALLRDDYLKWLYVQNPEGEALGYNALTPDGELAGHYAAIPIVAVVNDHEERGLLSLNTATHPSHTGQGLFTKLARATYGQATADGFSFVIGVANAASTHGFVTRLGFQLVCPLRAMVGLGEPRMVSEQKAHFERIWSPESLQWRLQNPQATYRCVPSVCGDAVIATSGVPFVRVVLGSFTSDTIAIGRSRNPFGLRLYMGLDPSWQPIQPFHINIPLRFRPSPLNLIFLDLTGKGRRLDAHKVRFRAIDFDAY